MIYRRNSDLNLTNVGMVKQSQQKIKVMDEQAEGSNCSNALAIIFYPDNEEVENKIQAAKASI